MTKIQEDSGMYVYSEICNNCIKTNFIKIPKGKFAREFIRHNLIKCSKCGCYLKDIPMRWR